jgi:hypothetical protein
MQVMLTMIMLLGFSQVTQSNPLLVKPGNTLTKPFCGFGMSNTLSISSRRH